jgi:dTDP-4-amino-4,6-dideoxygalactose transaminase
VPDSVRILEQEFAAWLDVPDAVAAGFGRAALRLGLEAIGCEGGTVLVPEFICTQVVDAVRAAVAELAFYPVGRDLTIRVDGFLSALKLGIRAALVPHYFGRVTANIAELAAACRERNVLLIEDCALAWGAALKERRAGTFGDIAIFSCTKSDWCYGGGLLAVGSAELGARARTAREACFAHAPRRLLFYGLLRRADFLANRPRWSAGAERAGRWLERVAGFGEENFYDAGRVDARISSLGTRRARRILRQTAEDSRRRRDLRREIVGRLRGCAHVLFFREEDPGEAGSFVLLQSPAGRAQEWVEEARRERITLRLSWPAYQDMAAGESSALEWLASHLVILEVHPRLRAREVEQIADCVRRLAARE